MTEREIEIKNRCRREMLEDLIEIAEQFGGIIPIRLLRNLLNDCYK